ncbi:HIT family protein [Candidatus Woesearchaeota archaeon]|nr:HIT family protein [Candidatus Woesearchaeota archaeon]
MTTCPTCDIITSKQGLLYEDAKIAAFLSPAPLSVGHILVAPKQHVPILEQVPDYIINELWVKANKLSIALFESIGAEGTNIVIANGPAAGQVLPHAMLNVVARKQNDGLQLQWQPKKLGDEEMAKMEELLKGACGAIGEFQSEPQKPIEIKAPVELPEKTESGESYLLKQLRRLP